MGRVGLIMLLGVASITEARADVFELKENGETVNVTTPVWRSASVQRPASMPQSAPTNAIYHPIVTQAANRYALSPALLDAVIRQESGYRVNAVSPVGAVGLMQLMPGTARSLGVTDSYDPVQNVNGGAAYLRMQLNRFGGNVEHALAAYNAGPGAVMRHGGIPPYRETQNYVQRILGRLKVPLTTPTPDQTKEMTLP